MRLDGWEEALDAVVRAAGERPFAYGAHDCCRFAAECVDAITGGDYLKRLSAEYHDEASMLAYLAATGGVQLAAMQWLGAGDERWSQARRGDVCLVPTERGDGLGVCVGDRIAVAADHGLALYPLTAARRVWRIE